MRTKPVVRVINVDEWGIVWEMDVCEICGNGPICYDTEDDCCEILPENFEYVI